MARLIHLRSPLHRSYCWCVTRCGDNGTYRKLITLVRTQYHLAWVDHL